jgi:hypothetical protein
MTHIEEGSHQYYGMWTLSLGYVQKVKQSLILEGVLESKGPHCHKKLNLPITVGDLRYLLKVSLGVHTAR